MMRGGRGVMLWGGMRRILCEWGWGGGGRDGGYAWGEGMLGDDGW